MSVLVLVSVGLCVLPKTSMASSPSRVSEQVGVVRRSRPEPHFWIHVVHPNSRSSFVEECSLFVCVAVDHAHLLLCACGFSVFLSSFTCFSGQESPAPCKHGHQVSGE